MSKLLQGMRNLVLAALTLVCVICVTEVGVRAMRWYQAAYDLKPVVATNESAIVVPGQETLFQMRPLASVELPDPETAELISFRTNSFGLRGPEIELPKPTGVFRILCLGDETTLAAEVGEGQTYCQQLQQLLQPLTDLNVEVVNAGLPGGCPLTCELLLRRRLLGVQPDLILLHCDDSDIADDRLARRFTRLDADGVPLAAVHPLASTGSASPVTQFYEEFAVLDLARDWLVDSLDSRTNVDSTLKRTSLSRPPAADGDSNDVGTADIDQALARLPQMRDLASGVYCEFIVSRCPRLTTGRLDTGMGFDSARAPLDSIDTGGGHTSLGDRLSELTREHTIAYVDATAEFGPDERQLYGAGGSNLSAEGHARYAHALAQFVYDHVPGVWRRQPAQQESPGFVPLPDVARAPRE